MKLLHLLWPCGIFRRGTFWFIEIIINFCSRYGKFRAMIPTSCEPSILACRILYTFEMG
jgi:hypothetical protein